jgi:hypothetical protein
MKRGMLLLLLGLAVCGTAFGQGKIRFNSDSLHLVYFNPDPAYLLPADAALAGQAVPAQGLLASGVNLAVDLYAGLSSDVLSLVATTSFGSSIQPGIWTPANVLMPPGIPAGTLVYFQVRVHDVLNLSYTGNSVIFAGTPTITSQDLTSFWPAGTYPMDTYGPGSRGAIMLSLVPEPGVLGFVALGLGTWLVQRGRGRDDRETLKAETLKR